MMRKVFFILSVSFLIYLCDVNAQVLSVQIDRDHIQQPEPFTLTLITDESSNLVPDWSPLEKDFQILGTAQAQQLTEINGKSTAQTQWMITLIPKRAGILQIPPIQLGLFQSQAISIHVEKLEDRVKAKHPVAGIWMEVNVTPDVYVQEQVLYIVKIFFDRGIENGVLSPPEIEGISFSQLGEDSHYQVSRNGNIYAVLERRYAFFPQKKGIFSIEPPVLNGVLQNPVSLNAYFGIDQLVPRAQPIRLKGAIKKIQVKAKPALWHESWWLPTKQLSLSEKWEPTSTTVRVGDPISREIQIKALGLPGDQLPNIAALKWPDGFNAYPDQPVMKFYLDGRNLVGIRQQKITLIPTKPGHVILPPVKLAWWNTKLQRTEIAVLPERKVHVLPVTIAPTTTTNTLSSNTASMKRATTFSVKIVLPWVIAALFMMAWLFTLLKRQPIMMKIKKRWKIKKNTLKDSLQSLQHACRINDAKQTAACLIRWAKFQWPDKAIRTLSDLMNLNISDDLKQQLQILERALYRSEHKWDGPLFWTIFRQGILKSRSSSKKNEEPLPHFFSVHDE